MDFCFLFPGQGAQYPGMGRDFYEHSTAVRELFQRASDAAGRDVSRLVFDGTEDELKQTDNTQIAITVTSLAAAIVMREHGLSPAACAGFSLGEYAALVESGVLALEDVFSVVLARGQIMEEVSRELDTAAGPAGMSAIMGLSFEKVSEVLSSAAVEGVYPGIWNSPAQTVISGTAEALTSVEAILKEAGAKRCIRLKVSGPFHSPLMSKAGARFAEVLADKTFHDPTLPVYSNVTGDKVGTGAEARDYCVQQLVSTVQWVPEQRAVVRDGFKQVAEVGPGTVLSGLWKNYTKSELESELPCRAAGSVEDIRALAEE